MDDLRRRFASLDRLPAPDLWDAIEHRASVDHPVARVSPVARPVPSSQPRSPRRTLALLVATAAVLVALIAGAVAMGSRRPMLPAVVPAPSASSIAEAEPSMTTRAPAALGPGRNGWIAFSVVQTVQTRARRDSDIWLTALDQAPRRVIGSDTDTVDQACPAFSPDGRSLAYGTVETLRDGAGNSGIWPEAYRDAALVIADVADDGTVADRLTYDVGDGVPLPCPVWSPGGDQLAFGVPRTSVINPDRSGKGSEVRVLRPADGKVSVVQDLLATDLDWSPDGSLLAIAGGVETASGSGLTDGLQDARIHLFEPATDQLRTLDDTLGVIDLAWSPDGGRIAYDGRGAAPASGGPYWSRRGLRIIDVESGRQEILVRAYSAIHGIGPVWSPDGATIAYQRSTGGGESSEVVLVTPDDRSEQTGLAREVALPTERATADGSRFDLFPWHVSWSPDGAYLLYVAWTYPSEDTEQTVVAAVPPDPEAPAAILADVDGIAAYDFAGNTMRVPIQTWGRR